MHLNGKHCTILPPERSFPTLNETESKQQVQFVLTGIEPASLRQRDEKNGREVNRTWVPKGPCHHRERSTGDLTNRETWVKGARAAEQIAAGSVSLDGGVHTKRFQTGPMQGGGRKENGFFQISPGSTYAKKKQTKNHQMGKRG